MIRTADRSEHRQVLDEAGVTDHMCPWCSGEHSRDVFGGPGSIPGGHAVGVRC